MVVNFQVNVLYTGTTESPDMTSSSSCESYEFECDNGECILEDNYCDQYDHCGDNSDEKSGCGMYL